MIKALFFVAALSLLVVARQTNAIQGNPNQIHKCLVEVDAELSKIPIPAPATTLAKQDGLVVAKVRSDSEASPEIKKPSVGELFQARELLGEACLNFRARCLNKIGGTQCGEKLIDIVEDQDMSEYKNIERYLNLLKVCRRSSLSPRGSRKDSLHVFKK